MFDPHHTSEPSYTKAAETLLFLSLFQYYRFNQDGLRRTIPTGKQPFRRLPQNALRHVQISYNELMILINSVAFNT
jgi:hypothetical protein